MSTDMNADITQSCRVIEVNYETNRAVVRFEGMAPEIGSELRAFALPVEHQYHYPDGHWRCSNGERINGMLPDQSRPLFA
jgi:hypothetical protein